MWFSSAPLWRRFPRRWRPIAGAAALWIGLVFELWPAADKIANRLPPPRLPSQADLESKIEISLKAPDFDYLGGDLVLLPSSGPVRLEVELVSRAPEEFGLEVERESLRWGCDGGVLLMSEPRSRSVLNSWLPPDRSAVSTVYATYEAYYRSRGRNGESFRIHAAKAAARFFLSPTRPEQLQNGVIDGFVIGKYPDPFDAGVFKRFETEESQWPALYPWHYTAPNGFYKVTRDNVDRHISKNFTLRFFATDFPWRSEGFPQYVALDQRLVRKLEDLLDLVVRHGLARGGFTPIYGFRRPAYNLGSIERNGDYNLKAPFSMHQYGRAVDLIIDEDGDLVMDDLNGDGFHDIADAAELIKCVNVLDYRYREAGSDLVGGAGLYARHDFVERPVQSPYVHIDVRGFLGQGGVLIRWPMRWPSGAVIVWRDLYPDWFVRQPAAVP